jgi:hypothetical protein
VLEWETNIPEAAAEVVEEDKDVKVNSLIVKQTIMNNL